MAKQGDNFNDFIMPMYNCITNSLVTRWATFTLYITITVHPYQSPSAACANASNHSYSLG